MFKPIVSTVLAMTVIVFGQTVVAAVKSAPKPMPEMKMEPKMGGEMDHDMMVKHLQMEQEHRLKIHDLSNKILSEKDPKKQEELKHQQLELMIEHHMHKMKMHHQMMKKHKMQQ
ncbi:MAG: hypothetical protein ACU83N_07455 [Gammaproteobacteria bacterium]